MLFKSLTAIILFSASAMATQIDARKVRHQGTADGLTRIDKDGAYIYDVVNPLKNQSSHLRFGSAETPSMSVDICQKSGTDDCASITQVQFEDIYSGASKFSFGYDYEYFFHTEAGKIGAQLGASFQFASGHGRLVSNPSQESLEKFTFVTLPIYLGAVYRFEYKSSQLIAPYVSGGGTYIILAEKREDRSKISAIGSLGFYGAGGVLFNITALDREMAASFNSEYGIGNLWVNVEVKTVQVSSDAFEYSANYIQGGMSFDF